ncbi:MAG: tRNA (N(6)-L-threonylcarbamoyladenosine(37)-C(2))-methylthiotransferase MtaB [Deltaproteobacteria bacterium]|nr:tRNA (N(6)-L-threonylcarbamoyladenosine(37)-C(2))-methylthiotransferase MtaB [Deltaproteobacteria bacterium]
MKPDEQKTIALTTLGCKVNQCDSAALQDMLENAGFHFVSFGQRADIYIINTCVVTARTEAQSRQLIRRALRANAGARVLVTGCYVQKDPEVVFALDQRVHIIGNAEKKDISAYVDRLLTSAESSVKDVSSIAAETQFSTPAFSHFPERTRAFLKIQDGCNSRCSYCIVPSVRGPSRSLPMPEVHARLKRLAVNGYREVVLTGIHLGSWGRDLSPKRSLVELLQLFARDADCAGMRIRISSVEPQEVTGELSAAILELTCICPHLHIPLQSGDPEILRAMRRPYDPVFFSSLIQELAQTIPGLSIGVDVIAGFPGETESRFENTRALLAGLPISYLHVFPYSRREGTPAAQFSDQVPEQNKKERVRALRSLSDEKKQAFFKNYAGKKLSVLFEGKRDKKTGLLRGIAENYIPVLCAGPDELIGTIADVVVETIDQTTVYGKL